jgi:amino acid adenylation domain-containing protein
MDADATTGDIVTRVQQEYNDSIQFANAGLVDIQKWSGNEVGVDLFETLLVLQNLPGQQDTGDVRQDDSGAAAFKPVTVDRDSSKSVAYKLELLLAPGRDKWTIGALYNGKNVNREMASTIVTELDFTISQMIKYSDTQSMQMWELSQEHMSRIRTLSVGSTKTWPVDVIHKAVELQCQRRPNQVAIEQYDTKLTYGNLERMAQSLAMRLARLGSCSGKRVGVVMQRCVEFPLAMYAALKTGASIVPIDSSFPTDRIKFMLQDSSACMVISTPSELDRINALKLLMPIVYVDVDNLSTNDRFILDKQHHTTGDSEAYVVYTSGSTGNPKGVPVAHKGAMNVVWGESTRIGCFAGSRMMQFMAIGFDACQHEVWSALSSGSTLVLREEDLFATIGRVDAMIMTPTGLSQIGHPSNYPGLRYVTVGGEACPKQLKDLWSSHVQFSNLYGPTEISMLSHASTLYPEDSVTIGKPIANSSCYILDSRMQFVPIGVVGELYLGGIGVSNGYINLPDLNQERFLPDLLHSKTGATMFKTGDLGRLLPDGNYEIVGRMDDQVKLRGYRVELDEVAAAMMRCAGVTAAAAIVKEGAHLIGFVTPSSINTDAVRDTAAGTLPFYMVPRIIVTLDSMPTNVNGKV